MKTLIDGYGYLTSVYRPLNVEWRPKIQSARQQKIGVHDFVLEP